jgi:hypothetical protein
VARVILNSELHTNAVGSAVRENFVQTRCLVQLSTSILGWRETVTTKCICLVKMLDVNQVQRQVALALASCFPSSFSLEDLAGSYVYWSGDGSRQPTSCNNQSESPFSDFLCLEAIWNIHTSSVHCFLPDFYNLVKVRATMKTDEERWSKIDQIMLITIKLCLQKGNF